jgi:cell division protein FtsL
MTIDIQEKLKNLFLGYGRYVLALVVALLLVHDVFGTHGFLAMRKKQQEIQKVTAELNRLNKENETLQQEQQDLKTDPQTIRKIAREELLLAEPGEIIIKLPPAIDATKK